jgi:hypothetical protein
MVSPGLALAAATLLLSVLVHFGADLVWLGLTALSSGGQSAAVLPVSNTERTSLADPNAEAALLPQVWAVPRWSSVARVLAPLPRDRALTRPPLVQPPGGQPTLLAGSL